MALGSASLRRSVGAQHLIFPQQTRMFQRALGADGKFVAGERLGDIVKRALLHGLDRGLDRSECGHEDHGQLGVDLADLREQLEPVHARHLQVGDHALRPLVGNTRERSAGIGRRDHHVALAAENRCDAVAHKFFVIDDENPAHS